MMVRAVVPPTVPEGTSRVRICLHAGNTEEHIERLVARLEEWSRSEGGDGDDGNVSSPKDRNGNGTISARL